VLIYEENDKSILEMALKKGHRRQDRVSKKGYGRLKENLKDTKSRKCAL